MCLAKENLYLVKIKLCLSEPLYFFLIITILLLVVVLIFKADLNIFLSTAVAAFIGTGSAFFLNTFDSKKKLKQKNIASLVKAKYIINIILKINEQINDHINKNKKTNGDYFEWEKITEYEPNSFMQSIEVESLLFLLEHNQVSKEILDMIIIILAENQTIQRLLEKRNQNYSSYIEKTPSRDEYTKEKLETLIGTVIPHPSQHFS